MTKRLWRDPNIYIGIAIAAIVIPTLIWAIVHHVRRGPQDNDFLVEMIDGNEKTLTPRFPPDDSLAWWTVVSDKSVDQRIVTVSVARWNAKVGKKLFSARQDQAFFDDPNYVLRNDYKFGHVTITVATEPGGEGCGGITHNSFDLKTGQVYWSDITINPMFTHDSASYEAAVVHELGHALLLAHDDHPSSIMRKKLNTRGKITGHDSEIVRGLWTQMKLVRP